MYVDTVGSAPKYQDKLSAIFKSVDVTVTPKADARFPIVSAASICAKVPILLFSNYQICFCCCQISMILI